MIIPGMGAVPLPGLGLLATEKLSISAHSKIDCGLLNRTGGTEVMYNPGAIRLQYRNRYKLGKDLGAEFQKEIFDSSDAGTLNLQLIFDSTLPGNSGRVDEKVAALNLLLNTPIEADDGVSAPPYLMLEWGAFKWQKKNSFKGRAEDFSASFSMFDSGGVPQRAIVDLTITGATTTESEKPLISLSTVVKFGTLTFLFNLAMEVAALANLVLMLNTVRENYMDNFDDFSPGDLLVMVPGGELLANSREDWE